MAALRTRDTTQASRFDPLQGELREADRHELVASPLRCFYTDLLGAVASVAERDIDATHGAVAELLQRLPDDPAGPFDHTETPCEERNP